MQTKRRENLALLDFFPLNLLIAKVNTAHLSFPLHIIVHNFWRVCLAHSRAHVHGFGQLTLLIEFNVNCIRHWPSCGVEEHRKAINLFQLAVDKQSTRDGTYKLNSQFLPTTTEVDGRKGSRTNKLFVETKASTLKISASRVDREIFVYFCDFLSLFWRNR